MDRENTWNTEKIFTVVVAIVIAILLRVYLLKYAGYSFDIATFISWADQAREFGIAGIYNSANGIGIDYPPLIPQVTSWWLALTRSFNLSDVYGFKLLPTIAELVLTVVALIYLASVNFKYKALLLAFIIIQPATAFVTSAWGQVDAILTLLVVLGFLLSEKNQYVATVVMALAMLVKPQAIIAVFIYLVWILFRKGFKQSFIQLMVGVAVVALVGFVFIQNGGNFLPIYWNSTSQYPYVSMNAFNFWWALYGSQAFSMGDQLGSVSAKSQGFVLFAVFLAPAIYYLKSRAKKLPELFLVTSYSYLIFFTFLTQMHERYLYPAVALLPFAILAPARNATHSVAGGNKKVPTIYIVLSATLLINCFVIMEGAFPQFSFPFLQNVNLVGDWTKIIGLANVLVAIYLALYFSVASLGGKSR